VLPATVPSALHEVALGNDPSSASRVGTVYLKGRVNAAGFVLGQQIRRSAALESHEVPQHIQQCSDNTSYGTNRPHQDGWHQQQPWGLPQFFAYENA
jgi:hypothetical protein